MKGKSPFHGEPTQYINKTNTRGSNTKMIMRKLIFVFMVILMCLLITPIFYFVAYKNVYRPEEQTIGHWLENNLNDFLDDMEKESVTLETKEFDGKPWDNFILCFNYADQSYYSKILPKSSFLLKRYLSSLTKDGKGPYLAVIRKNHITFLIEQPGPRWMLEQDFLMDSKFNYSITFKKSTYKKSPVLKVTLTKE